jgi:hypothetical protein
MTVWDDLAAEFPREAISWRAQSVTKDGTKAMALAYIDSRDVRRRLNDVLGHSNWTNKFMDCGDGKLACELSARVDGEWITKSDGAGSTDVEAEKGAFSSALKRAAVAFGVGEYLYDMPTIWVPCESYEKGGKFYWSKWKDDPWSYVRGKTPTTPSKAPKRPVEAPKTFAAFGASITSAKTPDDLKDAFAAIWKSSLSQADKDTLKTAYEAKKAEFIAPGNNFDAIARGDVK